MVWYNVQFLAPYSHCVAPNYYSLWGRLFLLEPEMALPILAYEYPGYRNEKGRSTELLNVRIPMVF